MSISCSILGCLYHSTATVLAICSMALIIAAVFMLEYLPTYGVNEGLMDFSVVTILFGGITIIMVVFMVFGAMTKHRCLLYLTAMGSAVMCLFQFACLTWMGFQASTGKIQQQSLKSYTHDLHYMNVVQKDFKCCGMDGPGDWNRTTWGQKPEHAGKVPLSCCEGTDTCDLSTAVGLYTEGCQKKVFHYMANYYNTIIALAIAVCLFQFCGIFLSCCIARAYKEEPYQQFKD